MYVISDLSGTLTTGSPIRGLVSWVKHHQSPLRARWFLAKNMPGYYLARRGRLDWQSWAQRLMIRSLALIHEATPDKVQQMAEWTVEHALWPKRRSDVIDRLAHHKQNGDQVTIASSLFEPAAVAFASRLGVQAIGTPVEISNGRLRLATELVSGAHKIEEVMNQLGVERLEAAYGDTWADIPLLERADHPVAVYPDDRLRATAEERGWEIMGVRDISQL